MPGSAAAPLRAQGDNQSCSPTLQVRNSGQGLLQPPECCSSSEAQPELGLLSRVDVRTLLSQRFVGQLNIAHTPSRLLGHDAHGVLFQVPCSPHNLSFVGRSCLWPPFHSIPKPLPSSLSSNATAQGQGSDRCFPGSSSHPEIPSPVFHGSSLLFLDSHFSRWAHLVTADMVTWLGLPSRSLTHP